MSHYAYDGSENPVGVLILAILLVLLTALLTILVLHILRYRLVRRLAAQLALHPDREPGHGGRGALRWSSSTSSSSPAADRDARYAAIERGLVSWRVRRHDGACHRLRRANALLGRDDKERDDREGDLEAPPEQSYVDGPECAEDDGDGDQESMSHEDHHGCPICMSSFLEGDIVSLSSNEECSHIYHHECIKEWLLRHTECPFCRHTFLEVDRSSPAAKPPSAGPVVAPPSDGAAVAFCCARHGTVALDPRLRQGPHLAADLAAVCRASAGMDARELVARRGARAVHERDHCDEEEADGARDDGPEAGADADKDAAATGDGAAGDTVNRDGPRHEKNGDDVEAGLPRIA